MRILSPDKPVEVFGLDVLKQYENGSWFAESKLDGYRCLIARDTTKTISDPSWGVGQDGSLFFLSRRGKNKGGPTRIPANQDVIASIEKLQLPDQIMLDGEWLARRTIDEIPESLFVFDVLWLNGEWQGNVPCWTRHQELLKLTGSRIMPECVESGFRAFFESRTKIPWTEGIVLKHKSSKVKGDPDECIKNALWVKLKWRSGDTGREVVDFNRV